MTEYNYYRVPFWHRTWVQRVVPWTAASLVHLVFLIVAALVVPPLVRSARAPSEEQIVIPDTTLAENGHLGGIPNPGMEADPSRAANQEQVNTNDAHGWAQRSSDSLSQDLAAPAAPNSDMLASGNQNEAGNGKASAALSRLGGGEGGGSVANFGPRGGGQGIGPRSRIFGSGSNVSSVIYVCDGSGSMLSGKDDILKRELKTAVASLAPIQSFNTIFFQERDNGNLFNAVGAALQMATPNDKTKLFGFLDHLEFRQGTNPIPAMEEAFREKPQLIYLLTDGEFDNPSSEVVMSRIDEMNRDKKVHIDTVLLLQSKDKEEENADFEKIMNKIAQDNGGTYKKYYADEW